MTAHLFRIVGVLALALGAAFSWGADNSQHKTAGGIDAHDQLRELFQHAA